MRTHADILSARLENGMTDTAKDIYREGYYRTLFDLQKGLGVPTAFSTLDETKLQAEIFKPWAPDGINFSERIWKDRDKLAATLHTKLTQAFIRGDSREEMIKNIASEFGKMYDTSVAAERWPPDPKKAVSNARRLIQTESAFFASQSELAGFVETGVTKYELNAVLDTRTSVICREMDHKVFSIEDFKPGITAPPFHPNCRTTMAPHIEDKEAEKMDGDSIDTIPDDMTYGEWYNQYVRPKVEQAKKDAEANNSLKNADDDGIIISGQIPDKKPHIEVGSMGQNSENDDKTGQAATEKESSVDTQSGAILRSDYKRMDTHAKSFYDEIRKRIGDVEKIAKNTDMSIQDLKHIKEHVFFNYYDLGDAELSRFDPSYDMAVSWQRLVEGKDIHEMDLVLLHHEIMEWDLINNKGLIPRDAHDLTNQKYNYQKYVDELDRKAGIS
jgi:SPP1 gp7 family putative phage head morphogenesis protein